MRRLLFVPLSVASLLAGTSAQADDFATGSLIVPMDTDYQDDGMFKAYGLVYELLREGVPVRWVIKGGKDYGDADFVASASDRQTGATITAHGYRGGPWVIDASNASAALAVIDAWQGEHPETAVHVATAPFSGDVARYLVVAPTIAMVADGHEDIARDYMQAAAIPDSQLDYAWPDQSPDMLDIEELSGPTETNHADGLLFDEDGDPVYCQLMSMHWGVADAEDNPEVVAEVREYLNHPTHLFAECQAVNAFENLDPHGFFLTPNGFEIGSRPDAVDFYNADWPFAQMDGGFATVGGSEPSYSLPAGDSYLAGGITMLTAEGTPEGDEDVWMTGFLDGACPPSAHECGSYGKVSYLGGHNYETKLPLSENAASQGTRLFLNSLFEAPCATLSGLPTIAVAIAAPPFTDAPEVTFALTYVNTGTVTALDATLTDVLPADVTFVSASGDATYDAGEVTWDLGNLGPNESGDLTVTVTLPEYGTYMNVAHIDYRVGLNGFAKDSNQTATVYDDEPPASDESGAGSSGSGGTSGSGSQGQETGSDPDADAGASGSQTATEGTGGLGDGDGSAGQGSDSSSGCGCTTASDEPPIVLALGLFGLVLARRRRGGRAAKLAGAGLVALSGCASSGGAEDDGPAFTSIVGSTGDSTSASLTASGDETGLRLDVGIPDDLPVNTEGCHKIDFLFVIDSSESMKDHQENLVNSFPGFVEAMRSSVAASDWHVMVVDTDGQWSGAQCANACQTLGSCPDSPTYDCTTSPPDLCDITIGSGIIETYGGGTSNSQCDLEGAQRFIDAGHSDLLGAFSCVAQVGVDGSPDERPMDALRRAISAEMNGDDACNAGFLREDAILVVTIITDEPDETSEGDPAQWAADLIAAKHDEEASVVVLALLPDGDLADPLCAAEAPAGDLATFVESFSAHTRASVCEPDYSPFLLQAVELISTACEEFDPPG